MNYQKIYNQIIKRAQNRVLEGYGENHHILPRCLNGSDDKENIVRLTAREHFLCHWLLARIHPENYKIQYAFYAMCNQKAQNQERLISSSRIFSEARESFSKLSSLYWADEKNRTLKSVATKKSWTLERREELRERNSKRIRTKESNLKTSNSLKGRIQSEETRIKRIASMQLLPKVTCEICKKLFTKRNFQKHYNYCRNEQR